MTLPPPQRLMPTVLSVALWFLFVTKLLLIILLPWLAIPSHTAQDLTKRYQAPSFSLSHGAILGTDQLGRDLFTRTLAGAKTSLAIAFSAMVTSLLLALVLGLLGGHYWRRGQPWVLALGTWLHSTPSVLLASVLLLILPRSTQALWLTLVFSNTFTMLRLVVQKIDTLHTTLFFTQSRSLGATPHHLAAHHLLPHIMPWLLVFGVGRLPLYIMQEATLSFLGLGIHAPGLSWGTLINDGLSHLHSHAFLLFVPLLSMIFCLMMLQWGLVRLLSPTHL